MKLIDLTGKRFGRLTVLQRNGVIDGHAGWECICDCGNKVIINGRNLRSGATQSCGCIHKEMLSERSRTHGMTKTRLYRIWHCMINRCTYKKGTDYPLYGGRGITVCDEWKNDFQTFRDWSMSHGYEEQPDNRQD